MNFFIWIIAFFQLFFQRTDLQKLFKLSSTDILHAQSSKRLFDLLSNSVCREFGSNIGEYSSTPESSFIGPEKQNNISKYLTHYFANDLKSRLESKKVREQSLPSGLVMTLFEDMLRDYQHLLN